MINLAKEVFPQLKYTPEELEQKFPPRDLAEGAMVTRICPSPTGFMHIGGLYAAMICERLAHQTGGVFYLRIEDTDKNREVAGAHEVIVNSFAVYDIEVDEGEVSLGVEKGEYGPYLQSAREDIYNVYVNKLLEEGKAYLCFCTVEELDIMRKEQEVAKVRPGYYGQWAKCRNLTADQALANIDAGKLYVVRFKSPGDYEKRIKIHDLIKGELDMPENDQDIVIRKQSGLPTYHFAHAVDDHLMRTTHVIRADEWVASLPLHIQLFEALGFPVLPYAHISPIQKMDGSSKRKLSKRKDPEANVLFYDEQGYPVAAVIDYMLTLANSNYEDWRREHPTSNTRDFHISLDKISSSGALFDFVKLSSISQDIIASYPIDQTYEAALSWSKKYDKELAKAMEQDKDYTMKVLGIERSGDHGRKDIVKWSDLRAKIGYFFDSIFQIVDINWGQALEGVRNEDVASLVEHLNQSYDSNRTKEQWFENLKNIVRGLGYADSTKEFKNNPDKYKGHVGDVAKLIRVALVGTNQSPDLSEVMRVLGKERVAERLGKITV